MSSIKPEERPKVIGLVTAIALVFGVGGVNLAKQTGLFGSSAPAPAAGPAATTQAPAGVGVASGTASGPITAPTMPLSNSPGTAMPPGSGPNPFRKIAPTATPTPGVPAPRPTPAAPSVTVRQIPGPSIAPGVFPIQPSGPSAPVTTVKPAPVPEPPLELVGVITGPDAIAMIRANAGEQFLHRGDLVQGYRVVRIGEDTVTLRRGRMGRILRVGTPGSELVLLPAAPADKNPASGQGSRTSLRSSREHLAMTAPAVRQTKAAPAPARHITPGAEVAVRHSPEAAGIRIVPMPAAVSAAPREVISVREPVTLPAAPADSGPVLVNIPAVSVPEAPHALPVAPVAPSLPADPAQTPVPTILPLDTPAGNESRER